MPNQIAMLPRANIVACMTCPICDKLLLEATTISLCLHTFCRKCIYEKLSDDGYDTCPVCDINLGCNPVDKLRPDHKLRDIRAKIFPMKRKQAKAPEAAPSALPPAKRKERSLSSLVSTPKVSVHAGLSERKKRAFRGKSSATRESSSPHEESPSKEEDLADDDVRGSTSPETLTKMLRNKKLVSSSAKSSDDPIMSEDTKNCSVDRKIDLWRKPLDCLVEAANRTKCNSTGISQVNAENGLREQVHDDAEDIPSPAKHRRLRRSSRSTPKLAGDSMKHHRQNMPIWFSLVASEDQNGMAPLPQVSSRFLRIKNGDMPVSSIQKYIANKLELSIEDEVQIMLQGQALLPNLRLRNLLDTWLKASPASRRITTSVGSSAKEFVMVLTYSRKPQFQPQQMHAHNNN